MAVLVGAVCSVVDNNASTGLQATFSPLLEGLPSMEACSDVTLEDLYTAILDGSTSGPVSAPRGPWVFRFRSKQAWAQVCNEVIPALLEICDMVMTSDSQQQQKEGIFRDVAVSAWTCCSPGCTNMAGQQEASLALSKWAGCGEARFCSR